MMWVALPYLVQVQICFSLFWLYYRFFLRRSARFALNRIYLILSVSIAFVIPALSIPVWDFPVAAPVSGIHVFARPGTGEAGMATGFFDYLSWSQVLVWIAGIGVVVQMLPKLCSIPRFIRYIHNSKPISYQGAKLVFTDKGASACSFFNYIFINQERVDAASFPQYLAHELAHCKLKHSWDLILSECMRILFWWNPIQRLWHHSLKEIHEYQADDAVLSQGFDAESYVGIILQEMENPPRTYSGFFSGFGGTLIRSRLFMIGQHDIRFYGLRVFFVTPVCLLMLFLFAFTVRQPSVNILLQPAAAFSISDEIGSKDIEGIVLLPESVLEPVDDKPAQGIRLSTESELLKHSRESYDVGQPEQVSADNSVEIVVHETDGRSDPASVNRGDKVGTGKENVEQVIVQLLNRRYLEEERKRGPVKVSLDNVPSSVVQVDVMPKFIGNSAANSLPAFKVWLSTKLRYPYVAEELRIEGRVVASFVVNPDGRLSDITIVSSVNDLLSREARRVLELSPPWEPARYQDQPVAVGMTVPIEFRLRRGGAM